MSVIQSLTQIVKHFASYDVSEAGFLARVETGGASGGSCWDEADDPGAQPYTIYNRDDPEFDSLRTCLATLSSIWGTDLTPIHTTCLTQGLSCCHEDTDSENDYYGNYRDFLVYTMPFEYVAGLIATEFKKEPKEWINLLLQHKDREARILAARLGAAWHEERSHTKPTPKALKV